MSKTMAVDRPSSRRGRRRTPTARLHSSASTRPVVAAMSAPTLVRAAPSTARSQSSQSRSPSAASFSRSRRRAFGVLSVARAHSSSRSPDLSRTAAWPSATPERHLRRRPGLANEDTVLAPGSVGASRSPPRPSSRWTRRSGRCTRPRRVEEDDEEACTPPVEVADAAERPSSTSRRRPRCRRRRRRRRRAWRPAAARSSSASAVDLESFAFSGDGDPPGGGRRGGRRSTAAPSAVPDPRRRRRSTPSAGA